VSLRDGALAAAAVPAAAHMVPSVVSLGQWAPVRALPGGWCRWRGPDSDRVALTFDDGPSPAQTPALLDRLDELGLTGTFFCVGSAARRHPDLVDELARRGHQVGVHGYHHEHHFLRTPAWVRRDLETAVAVLAGSGRRPRWFRPPFGQTPGATLWEARRQRLELVLWSVWGREWTERDASAVARRVTRRLRGGDIVLLHDSDTFSPPGTAQRARDALGPIAETLARRRLRAVTLDALVGPGPDATPRPA
jgi:peptidoglycan/xylan/chitin deacetylase (PgdA/CDA1 family)